MPVKTKTTKAGAAAAKTGAVKTAAKKTVKAPAKKAAKTPAKKTTATKAAAPKAPAARTSRAAKAPAKGKAAASKKKSTKEAKKTLKGLIIVESPAKARTLERFSKGRYVVRASMGHVRDLPKTRLGVDLEKEYQPHYITIKNKKGVVDELKDLAGKAATVLLAPDPDREGEAIAWHLAQILKVEDPLRIEMHEITSTAFNNALENPRKIDMDRVNAQQARRVLDRLVGYNLSPLLWRKITGGLSAGRVQSVAVKLICDRQKEIDGFVPREYWSMTVLASRVKDSKDKAFEAYLLKIRGKKAEIPDGEMSAKILAELKKRDFVVEDVKKKEMKKTPPPPYKTSTLQQEAYRRLGFTAKKTMALAQELYEGIDTGAEGSTGLITYMRTDSAQVSVAARMEAEEYITGRFGKEFTSGGRVYRSSAKAQEAHEAIRPTSCLREPDRVKDHLKRDQLRLYKIIWDRFVASQMAEAVFENTSVDILAGDYLFRASDSILKFPGYLKVYGEIPASAEKSSQEEGENGDEAGQGSKKPLPVLSQGDKLKIHDYMPKQHFTQPPPPYTEASLIKTLEEKGIGRPSTYAPIVDTIQKRGYVAKADKKFLPTSLGITVNEMLEQFFPNILDVQFTAGMEEKLDLVEDGKENWVSVIDNFYRPFSTTLKEADEKIPKITMEPELTDEVCDLCNKPMVIKRGRFGKFIACSGYPECKNTKPIQKEIGVACPLEGCGGQVIEKMSRKGKFFGCNKYPDCKFASWDKPINEKCGRCGKIMVMRFSRQGKPYKTCSDSKCKKK